MQFILIILFLILVLGLILKKDYSIVRKIIIKKPRQIVFEYIKLLRNQNEYSYYNKKDPQTIKSYSGEDGQVGFTYTWSCKNNAIGTGTQTISKINEGELLRCDILFTKPLKLKSIAEIALISTNENETKVTWSFTSHYKFPLNVLIFFVNLEKLIGNDIASSLTVLREKIEQQ